MPPNPHRVHSALFAKPKVEGSVQSNDGTLPQGTQISLVPLDQVGMPPIPGVSNTMTRAGADGRNHAFRKKRKKK